MSNHKPDFMWILALMVLLGVASKGLMGEEGPQMPPQQAGIIVE